MKRTHQLRHPNVQNHHLLATAMQRMAHAIRTAENASEDDKRAARHFEEMAMNHLRLAAIHRDPTFVRGVA